MKKEVNENEIYIIKGSIFSFKYFRQKEIMTNNFFFFKKKEKKNEFDNIVLNVIKYLK